MLIVQRRAGRIVHVPLLFMTFTALIAALGIANLVRQPGIGAAVGALVCVGLFVLVSLDLRVGTIRGGRFEVWSPGSRRAIDLRHCAFGVRVSYGSRGGATYTVYASDGLANVDLSDHFGERGADRALARLEALPIARDPAVAAVLTERRRAWQSAEQAARATVDAYYKSRGWRLIKWILLGGVALYSVVMIVMLALRSSR